MEDKDFIKIDDLYRGRPDKEERVPAGAWNNMQHLLDKAATTGGGAGGGRYGMYALLALLTVGMGAGAVTWQQTTLRTQAQTTATAQHQNDALNAASTVAANINQTSSSTDNETVQQHNNNPSTGNENSAPAHPKSGKTNANVTANATIADKNALSDNVANIDAAQNTNTQNTIAKAATAKQSRAQRRANAAQSQTDAQMIAAIQQNEPNQMVHYAGSTLSTEDIATAANEALSRIDKTQFAPKETKDEAFDAVVKVPNEKARFVVEKEGDEWKKEIVSKVNEIDRKISFIKQDDGKLTQRIDTVANKTFTRSRLEPLSIQDKLTLVALASNMPNARPIATTATAADAAAGVAANAAGSANSNLVLLSDYKVKSSNSRQSLVTRFYDMMSQYLDGQKPYYFGANIGAQAMFSSPLQSGFHVGVGGYYEFKERYTLGVEFKYLRNTFAGGGKITDNFSTFSNQVYSNSMFTATEQKRINEYTLQSSSYLELPITIRYQLSKLSLMGGVYGNYMTGTKHQSSMNQLDGGEHSVRSSQQFVSGTGTIVANDFKARYGMGLSIGAAYDFSRKLSLDMRINQNLWTSMKQTSHFSENLYRATAVQVSLFYFIGKKDKVIYMMNQK